MIDHTLSPVTISHSVPRHGTAVTPSIAKHAGAYAKAVYSKMTPSKARSTSGKDTPQPPPPRVYTRFLSSVYSMSSLPFQLSEAASALLPSATAIASITR